MKRTAAGRLGWTGLGLALLASTVAAGELRTDPRRLEGRRHSGLAAQAPRGTAPGVSTSGAGVAITVFANVSGTTEDAWFGAGIAETLAASLESEGVPVSRVAGGREPRGVVDIVAPVRGDGHAAG